VRQDTEYFTESAGAAQRRYEALRAYFRDEKPAAEVADRFGYSTASVYQMATLLPPPRRRPAARRPGSTRSRPPWLSRGDQQLLPAGIWSGSGASRAWNGWFVPSSICPLSRVRCLVPHPHLRAARTYRDVRRHIPAEARDTDR
jgi:hypothetical protein